MAPGGLGPAPDYSSEPVTASALSLVTASKCTQSSSCPLRQEAVTRTPRVSITQTALALGVPLPGLSGAGARASGPWGPDWPAPESFVC